MFDETTTDNQQIRLRTLLGNSPEEEFLDFDMAEIQHVLSFLGQENPIDLAHAEKLQQKALWAANLISEYLGKITKATGILKAKYDRAKNQASLDYRSGEDGKKTPVELKKLAGMTSPEAEKAAALYASAEGAREILVKKYDVLKQAYFLYGEIAKQHRSVLGGNGNVW